MTAGDIRRIKARAEEKRRLQRTAGGQASVAADQRHAQVRGLVGQKRARRRLPPGGRSVGVGTRQVSGMSIYALKGLFWANSNKVLGFQHGGIG